MLYLSEFWALRQEDQNCCSEVKEQCFCGYAASGKINLSGLID